MSVLYRDASILARLLLTVKIWRGWRAFFLMKESGLRSLANLVFAALQVAIRQPLPAPRHRPSCVKRKEAPIDRCTTSSDRPCWNLGRVTLVAL